MELRSPWVSWSMRCHGRRKSRGRHNFISQLSIFISISSHLLLFLYSISFQHTWETPLWKSLNKTTLKICYVPQFGLQLNISYFHLTYFSFPLLLSLFYCLINDLIFLDIFLTCSDPWSDPWSDLWSDPWSNPWSNPWSGPWSGPVQSDPIQILSTPNVKWGPTRLLRLVTFVRHSTFFVA